MPLESYEDVSRDCPGVAKFWDFGMFLLHDVCSQLVMCIRFPVFYQISIFSGPIKGAIMAIMYPPPFPIVYTTPAMERCSCRGMSPSLEFRRRFAGMYGHPGGIEPGLNSACDG